MVFFNFYDDWFKIILFYMVFFCFILILCVLYVNNDWVKVILKLDKIIIIELYYIWFILIDEEWIKVEVQFKDLILVDYGKKNNVNVVLLI